MRLALMIEGQEGVTWEHWLAIASACERHGIEALFRSDHYLSQTDPARPALDAWTVLAALANSSATANEISGGRVTLGMGTGWMEAEHERFGFPFPPMPERLRLFRA